MKSKTIVIAEAGVNHNGNINLAYKLIDKAVYAGADYVKFQTGIPKLNISKFAKKAKYQIKNLKKKKESQLKMIEKIALPLPAFKKLKNYCKLRKIKFLSSPFDDVSLNYLKDFNMDLIKIPSGEITNMPFLEKIGKLKKKIILSTGMSTIMEIKSALKILNKFGTKKKNITILQCNTEYPSPLEDLNLNAMVLMQKKLKTKIGFSDHSLGFEASLAAVALGAKVIEKHLTLSQKMNGPDHSSSLEPNDFKFMVNSIRKVEKCLGRHEKKPTKSERKNIKIARKSIVASKAIKKGEVFELSNITIKRPGSGISPYMFKKILGKKSKKSFREDELIKI